jgi:energy-coupling factor transporter ATP-binding protein EcfA2
VIPPRSSHVYALLRELASAGMAVVMLSTEVDEHVELMDRVLVFRERQRSERGELLGQVGRFGEVGLDDDRGHQQRQRQQQREPVRLTP